MKVSIGVELRETNFTIIVITLQLQVARAGRFGTKGLAITFVSDEGDAKVLNDVQERFEVNITELPEEIDVSSYCKFTMLSSLTLMHYHNVLVTNICALIEHLWFALQLRAGKL